jgi:hypothetical protein
VFFESQVHFSYYLFVRFESSHPFVSPLSLVPTGACVHMALLTGD